MLESEIIHLRLFATYQEFALRQRLAGTRTVVMPEYELREIDEIWEQIERLEAMGR